MWWLFKSRGSQSCHCQSELSSTLLNHSKAFRVPTCHQRNTIHCVEKLLLHTSKGGKRQHASLVPCWRISLIHYNYLTHSVATKVCGKVCSISTVLHGWPSAGVIKAEVGVKRLCLLVWIPAHWHLLNKLSSVGIFVCVHYWMFHFTHVLAKWRDHAWPQTIQMETKELAFFAATLITFLKHAENF